MMIFKKAVRVLLFLQGVLLSSQVFSQQEDSTTITMKQVGDPLQNRLFVMSTGRLMEEGRVSLSIIDLVVFQAGYSPTDFLQINATGHIPFKNNYTGNFDNISVLLGIKARIVEPVGYFQGLAAGIDIGYFGELQRAYLCYDCNPPDDEYYDGIFDKVLNNYIYRADPYVYIANITSSFGTEAIQAHLGVSQYYFEQAKLITPTSDVPLLIPSYVQAGLSFDLGSIRGIKGIKLITETLIANKSAGPIDINMLCLGFRLYSKSISFDMALLYYSEKGSHLSAAPYIGFSYIF